jgi:ADP-heptose:LPS heptosyltransferase
MAASDPPVVRVRRVSSQRGNPSPGVNSFSKSSGGVRVAIEALKKLERRIRKLLLLRGGGFTGTLIQRPEDAISLPPDPAILLLRAERIGDALVTVPIIRTIRRRYPGATIDILLTDANAHARDAVSPWIDRVWVYHKRPASALALVRRIRAERYDLMVDFQSGASATSQLAARWGGAANVLGLLHERSAHLTHAVAILDRRRVHIVDRLGQLLLAFGIDPRAESLDLEYRLSDADRSRAAVQLRPMGGAPRLAVNVSGRGARKYWGRDRFIAAIEFVRQHYPGIAIMVCGAPGDAVEVEAIAAATGADRVPPLPFHPFASVIHECDLLLTPDTSVAHLAAAWKIPAVVLFREDPRNLSWLPYKSPHRAVVEPGPIAGTPLERVTEALGELIEETWPSMGAGRSAAKEGAEP